MRYIKKFFYIASIFLILSCTTGIKTSDAATFSLENKSISYDIEGGKVTNMSLDQNFIELIVEIASTDDGLLQISIPRSILDAKFEETDDIFFIIIDGFQTEYVELTSTTDSRTIIIPFFKTMIFANSGFNLSAGPVINNQQFMEELHHVVSQIKASG